jgi:hypothetical protein
VAATRSSYSLRCFLACPWGSRSGIQVYAAETQAPYSTRVEIHSNFTVSGSQTIEDAMLPTNHAESRKAGTHARHQRVGRGWLLSLLEHSSPMADGSGWVTTFARGCMPLRRHWPVGVSLSTEFGYQRAAFSPDTWTWEIRPIVDRKIGPWYLAFNPALDRWFHGPGVNQGVHFRQRKGQLRLHEEGCRRIGILRGLWFAIRLRPSQRSAAAILPRDRHRFRSRMGV